MNIEINSLGKRHRGLPFFIASWPNAMQMRWSTTRAYKFPFFGNFICIVSNFYYIILNFYYFSCNILLFLLLCKLAYMEPKRSKTTQAASSSNPFATNATTFPTHLFSTKKHQEKYLRVIKYNVVRERYFKVDNFEEYEELVTVLEERGWTRLNSLIQEANQYIGLEFYKNYARRPFKEYTSYVIGKTIDYISARNDNLLGLPSSPRCGSQN